MNDTPDNVEQKPTHIPSPTQSVIDFEDDTPLVCNRNQDGDTTCEACQ